MRWSNIIALTGVIGLGLSVGWPTFAHEEEILVGQTAAGELHLHMDFAQPVAVPLSIFPGISGYAFGDLAFHSTILDEPEEDFFQLSTAANFQFVLLAKDPGVEVWNDTGTGFMATNETFQIGAAPFDTHPLWNIVSGVPGGVYAMTLKLRDLNNVYAESESFVISFTPEFVRPRLNLDLVAAQQIALSWPTNAAGWELQTAPVLDAVSWVTVTNVPTVVATNFAVTIPVSAGAHFFRLQWQ